MASNFGSETNTLIQRVLSEKTKVAADTKVPVLNITIKSASLAWSL